MLPYAWHIPAFKLGRFDGKIRFFQLSGNTYTHLLEDILPDIISQGYEIEIDDRRRQYDFQFPSEIDETFFQDKTWGDEHADAGQEIILRDYQVEAINRYLQEQHAVQELATGSGKTVLTAALSALIEAAPSTGQGKSIVIVPNKSLVVQTEADYKNLGLDVGVYYGDRKEFRTHTICTWQSLESYQKRFKNGEHDISLGEIADELTGLIVDECFSGESLVLTVDGYKRIDNLLSGDVIINFDEKKQIFKEDIIVKVHENITSDKMLSLEFDNGEKIHVTENHKFLTVHHGWVKAKNLTSEMEIIAK